MPKILNIGCGINNRDTGEVGLDISLSVKPEICGDVANLPFKDKSFGIVKAVHVLEHVDKIEPVMDECWRVLKDDGKLMVAVPAFPNDEAIGDPTHRRYFIPKTFGYFLVRGKLPNLKHIWDSKEVLKNDEFNELICLLTKVPDA